MLMYFASATPGPGEKPKAVIALDNVNVQEVTRAGRICFVLTTQARPYCFAVASVDSRNEWLGGFRDLGVFVMRLTGSVVAGGSQLALDGQNADKLFVLRQQFPDVSSDALAAELVACHGDVHTTVENIRRMHNRDQALLSGVRQHQQSQSTYQPQQPQQQQMAQPYTNVDPYQQQQQQQQRFQGQPPPAADAALVPSVQ